MKNKMGRPQIVPGESKSILIGARFSPDESKRVHTAIGKSGKTKSEWVRKTLLSAAGKDTV
ncbi:MAG TPA: hypothetical protein VGI03_07910 [Verrucomicrobiae bacterium]|jgi:hypothetical protein